MVLVASALVAHAPVGATHQQNKGLILLGGQGQSCQAMGQEVYADVKGTKVGLSAVCFDKPAGALSWYLEYEPTVPCTFPATADLGSRVMVYGSTGVVNQAFTLHWVHTTETVTTPPPC
ncbi:MAG TPA: hypothetical protein VNA87_04240 [Actinomycetota bacterium]|nr:hypothetical protein [Actinomycetota bacterium]